MILYTVNSAGNYLEFIGTPGTKYAGQITLHRKDLIKQVLEDVTKSALVLVDNDDNTSEYIYGQIENPTTGQPFTSLTSFRLYILTELNNTDSEASKFIDNWDAVTNQPVLADGALYDSSGDDVADQVASNAQYFIVVNADQVPSNNTTLDNESAWGVGDLVKSTGDKWVREPRASQIAAVNVSYYNTVSSDDDAAWSTVEDVQKAIDTLYARVGSFLGSLASLSDVDLEGSKAPSAGDALVYDGTNWTSGNGSGGRDLILVEDRVDGTSVTDPSPADGNYVVVTGNTGSWLPADTEINDIIALSSGTWTTLKAVSTQPAGALEIEYSKPNSEYKDSNYVWDGTKWEAIDAYEPNISLDGVVVSNSNLGDISNPPYGAQPHTGATLRGRSISKILDDILFQTIPHNYLAPLFNLSGAGGSFERGTSVSNTITASYTKREGGDLDSTNPSYIGGGSEIELDFTLNAQNLTEVNDSHTVGDRSINLSLSGQGSKLPSIASVGSVGSVIARARTADGDAVSDNKGNPTPQDSGYGGNTLAQVMTASANYYSRYPIWVGVTPERFTVSTDVIESTTIGTTPNGGSNSGGTLLDNAWLTGPGLGLKSLFTSNLNNVEVLMENGDVHLLVICPPGITVSRIEAYVAGAWQTATFGAQYEVFDVPGILSANGDEPRTYKAYYMRSLSAIEYTTTTRFRVTTAGSIQS